MKISTLFKAAVVWMVLATAVACGPSYQEMKSAREASYNISSQDLLDIAMKVTQRNIKVEVIGDTKDWFATVSKWYNPDGASEAGGAGGYTKAHDGSINVTLKVQVSSDGSSSKLMVKAIARRYKTGMAALEEFNDDDASKPGWVNGKADNLAYEIWEAAKKYQVTSAPGATAPISAAPATTTAAPAPAPISGAQ
jgi:hypothetical protein